MNNVIQQKIKEFEIRWNFAGNFQNVEAYMQVKDFFKETLESTLRTHTEQLKERVEALYKQEIYRSEERGLNLHQRGYKLALEDIKSILSEDK